MIDESQIETWIIEKRRELHRIPEESFREFRTQQKIIEILKSIGLEGRTIANTGVIATINGSGPGRTIALRADMDGLKVTEEISFLNRDYISQHDGLMHCCGHDGHMAMVLGAARMLMQKMPDIPGSVRLIFQPGEEQPPGGALEVIREGGLAGADAIVGLHIFSSIAAGEIRFRQGPFMATSNIMTVSIKGKGGHHLSPQLCIDPISIAARFVGCIHEQIRKKLSDDRFILGFGKICGGSQFNRTPDKVEILASFRAFTRDDICIIEETIRQTLEMIMQQYTNEQYQELPAYDLDIQYGYPVLVNDPAFSKRALEILQQNFPAVSDDIDPFFGAEDYAYYLKRIPGVYIGLGTRNIDKGITEANHSSRFDIDEDILLIGAKMCTTIILDFLRNPEEYLS